MQGAPLSTLEAMRLESDRSIPPMEDNKALCYLGKLCKTSKVGMA